MAHRLGIVQGIPNYLPITLGVADTTPLEMATVASTLANGGVHHDPVFVQRVVAPGGAVLVDNTRPQGTQVLASDIVVRLIPSQGEIRVGVVTALIGAPFFIALIMRRRHELSGAEP